MANPALSPQTAPKLTRHASRRFRFGAAALAIATAGLSQQAAAQSFQGTPTVLVGNPTFSTSPNNTTIFINGNLTVINWQPTNIGSGPVLFQPAGTTAEFFSANTPDFAVLNRILPVDASGATVLNRPVRFDGTVTSTFSSGNAGSIWFYTPGGIILGGSSVFDVGSLVLSTSDINPVSLFVGNNGTINFTGTPNPASVITLENGARVNALINGSSYVAMVAPRIVQNGNIQVDGSAALVGAEAVDITMNGVTGLFDIAVSAGTSDTNGVVHGELGTTSGPGSGGSGDPKRIYMVAIPKNTAISMLVNGNVGYTPAATATVQNGEVVLSAGYNIANGGVDPGEHAVPVNNVQANLTIGETSSLPTSFSSRVFARASGNLLASPGTAINGLSFLAFSGSAFLLGDTSSVVEAATANELIAVGGDLFVSSRRAGQGGNAAIRAIGGLIAVGGALTVDASSLGFSGTTAGISLSSLFGGNGRGGNASINVVDGNLRINGATQVAARGIGGYGIQSMGSGFGGNATVNLTGANAIALLTGGLNVQGEGFGVLSFLSSSGVTLDPPEAVDGGNGTGGSAVVNIGDINQLTLPTLTINASGTGDNAGASFFNGGVGGGLGGFGIGGTASLSLNDEALVLPELIVEASGFGGSGGPSVNSNDSAGNGGAGFGGTATITLTGTASVNQAVGISGEIAAIATGNGGSGGIMAQGGTLDSGSGGSGTGGAASISIGGASQLGVDRILAFADGISGRVGNGTTNFGGTGIATGGDASVTIATTGTVNANLLRVSADALTYQTSRTGDATGGTALLTVSNGVVNFDDINVSANASIDPEAPQNVGSSNGLIAGNSTGGTASLSIAGGTLTTSSASVAAIGRGGGQNPDGNPIDPDSAIEQASAGGTGTGGNASFSISGGSVSFAQPLVIDASGQGGNGYINADTFATQPVASGAGGAGIGGTASLNVTGGLLTAPIVDLRSNGTGGNGADFWGIGAGNAGAGGNGIGGTTNFNASQDVFNIDTLTLSATGSGGIGGVSAVPIFAGSLVGYGAGAATGGSGGNGLGGRATLSLDFDPVMASLIIDTSGIGGNGNLGLVGGVGGNGFGGSGLSGARLALNFGNLTVDALIVRSNGTGGNGGEGTGASGGVGGNGTGGDADLLADGAGSNLTTLNVLVQANGLGGNGGISRGGSGAAGGNAQGGNARLTISNAATANLGATLIAARATGGDGSASPAGLPGGSGGNAVGGNAALAVTAAAATSTDILVQTDGRGGNPSLDGIGGNGTGGGASVAVTTGSYSANVATITANGRGGPAGGASTGGNATISSIGGSISFNTTTARAEGETGLQAGGLVSILAGVNAFGTSGVMSLGLATLSSDAVNGAAGIVRINNNNGNPAGGAIQFSQLFASADGFASTNPAGGVFVRANQSDISVLGDANLFARDSIHIDGIGQGTFAVAGNVNGTAGRSIFINHSGQPGLIDTVRGTIVSFFANNNIDAQTGSIIRAGNLADIQTANGIVNIDQLFAANNSVVAAGADATIRNVNITNGSLNLAAGRIIGNTPSWRRATATIQGAVTVSNTLVVNSGGDIVTGNGAIIRTGNSVVFNAGDDIIVRNTAINSALNVTASGEIQLNSGAITPVDAIVGEIRSLVIANSSLTSTGFDVNLNADAIDATSATLNANRLTATVNNAQPAGVAGGNDGGLLAANCIQGNICIGAISTPTQILIGPATGSVGLANRVTMAGTLASNNISIRARDGITFAGPLNAAATNNLLVSVLNGPIDLTGGTNLSGGNSLNLYAGAGAITGPNTALSSNGNIGLFANGGITLGSIDTGGVLTTIANDGSITTASSLVTSSNVTITGQLAVRGGAANINSGGAITTGSILTTSGNDVLLTSAGGQSLGAVNSGRDLIVNAASLNATSVAAQRDVNAVVSGSATLGNITGTLITLRAGQDVTLSGTATATTAIDVSANGQAGFNGAAGGTNITVRSGNILISGGGRLGTIGTTQNVILTNSAGAQMTIGGSGVTGGYSLSDAELARIFGNNIDISWTSNLANTGGPVTPPTGGFAQPSIVVGALTLASRASITEGNLAANGTLSIRTPGTMRVNGAVALNGAGSGNTLRLSADQSLQIIPGQGSIAIRDGVNALAGTINLNSNDIIAASPSAIADIAGQSDRMLINTRLGMNDGFVSDIGTLSADTINLNAGNNIFVQNTGNGGFFRDRRGITANAIEISLIGPAGLPNPNGLIVINGQITATRGFATGLSAIPLLSINGTPSQTAAGFDSLSTMNGCQITAVAACRQQENPISVTHDDINKPFDTRQIGDNQFPTALIEMKETETFGYPPLIDEPVTGSGNDDLWPATCEADDETCPAPSSQ